MTKKEPDCFERIPTPDTTVEGWEEKFDKDFPGTGDLAGYSDGIPQLYGRGLVKQFIRTAISDAVRAERAKVLAEIYTTILRSRLKTIRRCLYKSLTLWARISQTIYPHRHF